MNKILLMLTLVILALVLARQTPALRGAPMPPTPQFQAPQEGKGCSVPKAWGQLKGVADRAIAFEDSAGTIRVLDTGPCMRGQTELIVLINRQ